jgi:hypothetical protein
MRKLITTNITDTVGMPVKAGTWDHLQLAYQEALNAIMLNIIPNYQANTGYILFGCVNTGSGSSFIISAGAIFYNGEIFLVPAATFTAAGGQTAVANITTTQYTSSDRADPVTFTNGTNYNIHNIRQLVYTSAVSGSGAFDFGSELYTIAPLVIKEIATTLPATVTVNFKYDQSIFYTGGASTVNCVIGFSFTNAVPGTVVRIQWVNGSTETVTVTPPGGAIAYEEGGDITRVVSHTNSIYFTYVGIDGSGNNIVGYSVAQIA